MKLPLAFPDNARFANLKKFQASPVDYMKEAVKSFGAPVDLNLPMGDFVLTDEPGHAHHVLNTAKDKYRKSKGYKEIARVLGNGLLTAEGEQWHSQRKALQPSFHKNELRALLPAIWDTGADFVKELQDSEHLALEKQMGYLTLTVLLNSLIHYQDEELKDRMISNIVFSQEFIVNRIRSPFKLPTWVPTRNHRRYHNMMRDVNAILHRCVQERKTTGDAVQDILTVLMKQHDPDREFYRIRDELLTFFVAGHETSALALSWGLHLLAHHPDIQQRLYEEVKALDSLDKMDLMNFSNLDYLQLVVKEILRIYPPIWNIVRLATEDDELGGYHLPKGKQVMCNIYLLHHNAAYWDQPDVFNPERFRNLTPKHKLQYMPFGGGPRFCIGNNFALFEIMILLSQVVREWQVLPLSRLHPGFNPLLTLRPDEALQVQMVKRK
ncbi:cytochrome P450 [Roseivirga sp. BDSF3-8]|uniref:cytochrome P450 n=1 Tax=Roseivirga sp. BDSF3-8 TaxID=3241598 RepID=UPI003531C70C